MGKFLSLLALLPTMGLAQSPFPESPTPADFHETDAEWVALGRQLFFDPVLAGNNNIACATCQHPSLGTADAMSLSLGEGAQGLGQERTVAARNAPKQRIPRNAPALWNLGAKNSW